MIYICPKFSPIIEIGDGSANIGISENHTFGNDVVSQPLEDGTNLFDHIVILPDELEVVIHTGNAPKGGDRYPSQVIYSQLKQLRNRRELCDVYTLHEVYTNMAIKDVTVPNVAPFNGRTDITVKFTRVDIVSAISNILPRATFQAPFLSANGEWLAFDRATAEQAALQLEKAMEKARKGMAVQTSDVVDAANTPVDLGEGDIFEDFPDPWGDDGSLDLSVYDNPPTDALKTAYAALQNIMQKISNAYSQAGNMTQDIRNKMQIVSSNIAFISNLSIGAQRFIRTIKGQVLGIYSYFDVLTNNWSMSLTDAQGRDIIAGGALVLGVNILQGLNLKYGETNDTLSIKGLYMTRTPDLNSNTNKGIESSPYAFAQEQDGTAPCSIFLFTDATAVEAYDDLINGIVQKEINFNINKMDYTII